MAHPKIVSRTLVTAGTAAALTVLPLAGSAFALGSVEDALAPATDEVAQVLPAPAADAVDEAAAPVKEAVEEAAAPVVQDVVKAAPAPVREAAGPVTGPKPSAGPVETAPMPAAPVAPRGSASPAMPAAPGNAHVQRPATMPSDSALQRVRGALASTPMSSTPFPSWAGLLAEETPLTAAREDTTSTTPVGQDVPGWLVATATGLVMLMGAAHILTADGRIVKVAQ